MQKYWCDEFEMAIDITKHHHEEVNGTGHPEGLTDE